MIGLGETLDGKYQIVQRLGAGGFGEVFLAEDEAIPGRRVAIKAIQRTRKDDDLIWEMRTLAQFSHPHIVAFYHHFTHDERLYIVMEYCPGGSLDDRLAALGGCREHDVCEWGLALCETLGFVHGKGIVHHDIKPANILFMSDGTIKLGDFGVANRHMGTYMYLPPEVLLGEAGTRTDPRIDIYALGLTLLEALTGRHPLEHLERHEVVQAQVAHDFVPTHLPDWIQAVVLKATHPTPELRFQTAAEFAEAIRSHHVPHRFDSNGIRAHVLVRKAKSAVKRKNWKRAEELADAALQASPDYVAALVAAGRCQLGIRRIAKAEEYFSKGFAINPRVQVQKELGWLNLEKGNVQTAISFLSEHLQRNAADFEAYNLLAKCYYVAERYEAAEELFAAVMEHAPPSTCFRSNRLLCRVLWGGTSVSIGPPLPQDVDNPFTKHNYAVLTEEVCSWGPKGGPTLKSKLLFQEYRFGVSGIYKRHNTVVVETSTGNRYEITEPIVTIGSTAANDIVLKGGSVSRRHCVLINFPNDVWIYDLESTAGTVVDGDPLTAPKYLDGAHSVIVGGIPLRVAATNDVLL